ncbi:uncharacterized protein JCM6883_006829 [Sporobolomyces salmoneus]|uniref:uncharacterized protein n=1 Tax=Sporobolomyces salmoneus TaxID=183962 RepID=UPI00316E7FE3
MSTTSPSLIGDRLSHLIRHEPLDSFVQELERFLPTPHLLDCSDFSLRLLLSIPLLAHARDPTFRLATFCLLLAAGCDPESKGADGFSLDWELSGIDGQLKESVEAELNVARDCRERDEPYQLPPDVQAWIENDRQSYGRYIKEEQNRLEEERSRVFAKLNKELAEIEQSMRPPPAKRQRIEPPQEEELPDYEEVVGGESPPKRAIETPNPASVPALSPTQKENTPLPPLLPPPPPPPRSPEKLVESPKALSPSIPKLPLTTKQKSPLAFSPPSLSTPSAAESSRDPPSSNAVPILKDPILAPSQPHSTLLQTTAPQMKTFVSTPTQSPSQTPPLPLYAPPPPPPQPVSHLQAQASPRPQEDTPAKTSTMNPVAALAPQFVATKPQPGQVGYSLTRLPQRKSPAILDNGSQPSPPQAPEAVRGGTSMAPSSSIGSPQAEGSKSSSSIKSKDLNLPAAELPAPLISTTTTTVPVASTSGSTIRPAAKRKSRLPPSLKKGGGISTSNGSGSNTPKETTPSASSGTQSGWTYAPPVPVPVEGFEAGGGGGGESPLSTSSASRLPSRNRLPSNTVTGSQSPAPVHSPIASPTKQPPRLIMNGLPSFVTPSIWKHFLTHGPRSFESITSLTELEHLEVLLELGSVEIPERRSEIEGGEGGIPVPIEVDVSYSSNVGEDGRKLRRGVATYRTQEEASRAIGIFKGKKLVPRVEGNLS